MGPISPLNFRLLSVQNRSLNFCRVVDYPLNIYVFSCHQSLYYYSVSCDINRSICENHSLHGEIFVAFNYTLDRVNYKVVEL